MIKNIIYVCDSCVEHNCKIISEIVLKRQKPNKSYYLYINISLNKQFFIINVSLFITKII